MATAGPIFIHSLFRSASSCFVQKFRAIETFSCYQEPCNESLAALNHPRQHERLLEPPMPPDVREPRLDRPDFHEFWERREPLRGLFRASFAYEHCFAQGAQLPPAQRAWLSAIIEQAPARPVLQFCRSAGRVAALRSLYGGTHLHLWREPRAQWWSYRMADYFDSASQRIYRSAQLPEALRRVRRMAGIQRWRLRHPLPRGSYVMLYGLWLDAWLRLCRNCDLSISIDRIALDPAQNAQCAQRLAALVGSPIDLSDVRAAGIVLTPEEEPFYTEAEEAVREVFARTGHATPPALQAATAAAADARAAHAGRRHDGTAEQNLRLVAMTLMRSLAGGGRPGGGRWPHRWYPKRLQDYLHWALQRLQQRPRPPIEHSGARAGGEDAVYRATVQSPHTLNVMRRARRSGGTPVSQYPPSCRG